MQGLGRVGNTFEGLQPSTRRSLPQRPAAASRTHAPQVARVAFDIPLGVVNNASEAASMATPSAQDSSIWAADRFELGSIPEQPPPMEAC
jgi:hypothetical protein